MGGAAVVTQESGRGALYTGRVTASVIWVALAAASGGLLFGWDNGVTGGVIAMPDFASRFFPSTLDGTSTNAYCKFNDHMLQLFTSSLFLAGALSALTGMWTCRHWGRRVTMGMGGVCFLVGTALVASAFETAQLVVGRVILGFGVGFATQSTPLYLSEMAPFKLRGALNIMFQLAVTIGIFAAQLVNYGTKNIAGWGWRLSLALGAVPAILLCLAALALPDTPNSLVQRGRSEAGLKVLRRIRGVEDVNMEFEDISEAVRVSNSIPNPWKTILLRRYRPQLVISILIPIFQQFTGINSIMFYAPQLFATVGSGSDAALLNTVIIGAVNVGSTIVAIIVVDRFGRRVLFQAGGAQMLICEIIVGTLILKGMGQDGTGIVSSPMAKAIIAFICLYVAGFAWSWGPLGWLVPSEIQPLETRTSGTAINTCVNFLTTFIIGQCFLSMLCTMKYGVFYFFGGFVVLMTIFTFFFVPETRNVPIEEVEEVRIGKHWFWRRVVAGTRPPVMPVTDDGTPDTTAKNNAWAPGYNNTMGQGPAGGPMGSSPMGSPMGQGPAYNTAGDPAVAMVHLPNTAKY